MKKLLLIALLAFASLPSFGVVRLTRFMFVPTYNPYYHPTSLFVDGVNEMGGPSVALHNGSIITATWNGCVTSGGPNVGNIGTIETQTQNDQGIWIVTGRFPVSLPITCESATWVAVTPGGYATIESPYCPCQ